MKTKKKLSITFLDFDDIKNPLLGAGQARATVEVGKRLVNKGHSVNVISSRYPGYKDRIENGIEYKHIGLGSRNIKLNNIIYILTLPLAVRKLKNTDIIIECFTAPISTLFSPIFTKIPVIALTTSFEAEMFGEVYHLPFLKLIEKFGLRFYKYFMPYTDHYVRKIKSNNPKAIVKIIPEGVGKEFFAIKRRSLKYILFLGRLDIGQKGIDLLLEAYARIQSKVNYPLIIAGNGPDETRIKEMIHALKLSERVKMIGATFGKKKNRVLSEAFFVAFPSRHEGFPLFSLEALAAGLPLVAFDIPGLSWAKQDTVLKAKPFDINQYSSLLLVANKNNEIKKMSQNARKFAKQFTWENVVNQFESFFYEVLDREEKKHEN